MQVLLGLLAPEGSHMARPAEPAAVPAPVMAQPVYCPAYGESGVEAEVRPEPSMLPKGTTLTTPVEPTTHMVLPSNVQAPCGRPG